MIAAGSFADFDVALSDVPWPAAWAAKGRCRSAPPTMFFPGRGEDASRAKALCAHCPVLDECRAYALAHPDLRGVWAGLSGRDRRELRLRAAPPDGLAPAGPPSPNPNGTRYRTLEALVAHPGRWARVARYAASHSAVSIASQLRNGHLPVPPGRWRFEGRVNDHGGSDLYAYLDEAPR